MITTTTQAEVPTTTWEQLKEKSLDRYRRMVEEDRARTEELRRQQEMEAIDRLITRARAVLGLEIDHEAVEIEQGFGSTMAWVELEDGVVLRVNHGRAGLQLGRRCPDCDGHILSHPISRPGDVGAFLFGDHADWHEHWFKENSEHPNAPAPRASIPLRPVTIGEQLERLFRQIAREESAADDE